MKEIKYNCDECAREIARLKEEFKLLDVFTIHYSLYSDCNLEMHFCSFKCMKDYMVSKWNNLEAQQNMENT